MTQDDRYDMSELPETQFEPGSNGQVLRALAETLVELVLIHPFRDGNGRLARVLSTMMALQAGLPLLDFSMIAGTSKKTYIAAIQAGLDKHYGPMESLLGEIIEQSRLSS